jgi:SP family arabinose:H+ symporter-like MFS transporter
VIPNGEAEMSGSPNNSTGMFANVLLIAALVSLLAGFLFGYDNLVISGAIGYLSAHYHLDPVGIGWAAGCALIGCFAGSATAGCIADTFGLRKALYSCAACFALSSFGVWMAPNFTAFAFWRILGGIGIGAASIVGPMYIAEIAPAHIRGRLVVLYQLGIVLGILAAVYIDMLIERSGNETWNIQHGWRFMFLVGAVPAVLFTAAIVCCKESPRWLMKMGRGEESEHILAAINGYDAASAEAAAIRRSLAEEHGGLQELFVGSTRFPLLIGVLLAAFSQLSGITALLSFLPEVFQTANKGRLDPFLQSVLVAVVNVAFTLIAIWLVDRAGRKSLILTGTAIQTCALAAVGGLYLSGRPSIAILAGVMAFVAGHAVGNGAVCWVIISEIFPTRVRGIAMSVATMALWMFAYLANQFFPVMQMRLGRGGTFFFFATMAAVNFIFVLSVVPETRAYSLEEIREFWLKRSRSGTALIGASCRREGIANHGE